MKKIFFALVVGTFINASPQEDKELNILLDEIIKILQEDQPKPAPSFQQRIPSYQYSPPINWDVHSNYRNQERYRQQQDILRHVREQNRERHQKLQEWIMNNRIKRYYPNLK
jgi:hypothetical protein